jgi:hypothetical protein
MDELLIGLGFWLLFSGKDDKAPTPEDHWIPGVGEPPNPNAEPDPNEEPDPDKPTPTIFVPPPKAKPDLPGTLDDYPTAGALYKVTQGDTGLGKQGIAGKAVAQAAYSAAVADGMTHEEALGFASAARGLNISKYWAAIQGHLFNDRLYATYGYGPKAVPNPTTKRALRLLPMHADNLSLLAQGLAPQRSITLSTKANAGQGTGKTAPGAAGGNLELLFLPSIDTATLLATGGQVLVVGRDMPKWLVDLGWLDRSGAPAGTKWGA